jgi:hypothetical protein
VRDGVREYALTDLHFVHPVIKDADENSNQLVDALAFENKEEKTFSFVRFARDNISIYDSDGLFKKCFYNTTFREVFNFHDGELYCLTAMPVKSIMTCTTLNVADEKIDAKECFEMVRRPGYGALDLNQLLIYDKFDYRNYIESSVCAGISAKL